MSCTKKNWAMPELWKMCSKFCFGCQVMGQIPHWFHNYKWLNSSAGKMYPVDYIIKLLSQCSIPGYGKIFFCTDLYLIIKFTCESASEYGQTDNIPESDRSPTRVRSNSDRSPKTLISWSDSYRSPRKFLGLRSDRSDSYRNRWDSAKYRDSRTAHGA